MQELPQNPGPCEGFDEFAGKLWIYPNNMAIRGYQKQAVEKSLFNNSMIVLPTGFGKTFIAAVVMYNFYRWYPQGKIIFVAPTRPLVAQQIVECKKISGIPSSDCVELTGQISSEKRLNLWLEKRVFFATPQVIENDLASGILPPKAVRCIVIDEAHRAQGGYAYVEIVKTLHEHNKNNFRVMALSATPGSDIQRVRQVMLNLYINEVMFRSENSIDLMQFKNEKLSRAWTVELPAKHKQYVDMFIKITNPTFKELYKAGLTFSGQSIESVAKYTLIKAMKDISSNEVSRTGTSKGRLKFLCSAAMNLSHHFELITLYGLRVFYSSIQRTMLETRSNAKSVLNGSIEFEKLKMGIEQMFGDFVEPNPSAKPTIDLTLGHPKLKVVKELLFKHFEENKEKTDTRAIVFTKFRESVFDIVQTLSVFEPLIRAGHFVGQGGNSNTVAGMKQRDQIQLIIDFKAGKYNVLVATCVAEEGLDIGEVDLIICYDTTSSPISSTQRRGRTGRKRSGNVQTLVTKHYEEKRLQKAGASRRQVEDQLYKRENYMGFRYKDAPRMVPMNVIPVCMEQRIYPIEDEVVEEPKRKRKRAKKEQVVEQVVTKQKKKIIESDDDDDDLFSPKKSEPTHQSQQSSSAPPVTPQKSTQSNFTTAETLLSSGSISKLGSADSDIEWDDDFDMTQVL